MSCDWQTVQLSECAVFQEGYVNPSQRNPEYFDGPIKWLRAVDLNDAIVTDTTRTLSELGFKSAGKSALLFEPGSLAISKSGTIGRIGILENYMCGNRAVINIRVDNKVCDKHFIFYVLKFRRSEIEGMATGSVQKNLYTSVLGRLELQLPPMHLQRKIATYLWSLDKAIHLNQQINQTLEQIAQAIFKSWFVDFEPVKAKIAARRRWHALQPVAEPASPVCYADDEVSLPDLETYMNLAAMQAISGKDEEQLAQMQAEQPEEYGELLATAVLFPSVMQVSELGEIPEGWWSSTIGQEFDITMGQSPPGETYNEVGDGVPFFQGRRDFGERFPSDRVYCSAPKRMAKEGDTLLSVRAPVGDTNIALMDCCIGRGLAAIRHKSGCTSFTYYSVIHLGQALSSYDAEGTVFGSINQKNLKAISVVAPSPEVLAVFTRTVGPIDRLISVKSEEAATLSDARDTLLPKLLSGEISVFGAEGQLAEAKEVANV